MIKAVSVNIRPDDRGAIPFLRVLVGFLEGKGAEVFLPDYPLIRGENLSRNVVSPYQYISSPDLVVVMGGDGTLLRTARLFADSNKPIFGVNRGRLGFLTEFSPEEALRELEEILKGNYEKTERTMLEAVHSRGGAAIERMVFLNDAVISKGAFSRPIWLNLEVEGEFLASYSGDGLIIATATGSTAYSLSAGGPIIIPDVENVYIINPICPHTLAMRPILLSTTMTLRVRIESEFENLLLTIDGQEAIRIEGGDEMVFRGSNKKIYLINHPQRKFCDILREKLGWGEKPGLRGPDPC